MEIKTQLIGLGLLLDGVAIASAPVGTFSIPHTFQAGDAALASEVNENFQAIFQEVTAQANSLDLLTDSIALDNVIRVSPSGADFSSIRAALDSIQDATANNPYLVQVAPGVYRETLVCIVPSFVELRGSGPSVSFLLSTGGGSFTHNAAAVDLRDSATLSDLAIHNDGTGENFHFGIAGRFVSASTRIKNVQVIVLGSGSFRHVALYGDQADWVVEDSEFRAAGATGLNVAFHSDSTSRPLINRCRLEAFPGTAEAIAILFSEGSPRLSDCELFGNPNAVVAEFRGSLWLDHCILHAPAWANSFQTALIQSVFCTFDGGNATSNQGDSFLYTHCVKDDGRPVVNGFGSSVE